MKFTFTLLTFLLLIGCNSRPNGQEVTGDLYYHWFKFGSFYGQADSVLQEYLNIRDSLGYVAMMEEDSAGTAYVRTLEENSILTSPFIFMKKDNGNVLTLYLDSSDFRQFTNFSYQELIDSKQKVRITANIDSIANKLYLCKSLISVELVDGSTLVKQGKFKIEEYR
jgi:hypothetical protein